MNISIDMTGFEMEGGCRRVEDETGGRGVAAVERTRRGVEAMEVAGEEVVQKGERDGAEGLTRSRYGV